MKKTAVISEDQRYRYLLSREWDATKPRMCSFMLNPSTADAFLDDPTIRRNINFAETWGYGALDVVNPFGYRSSSPAAVRSAMQQGIDVVGPQNGFYIDQAFRRCSRIMVAWGAAPWAQTQAHAVLNDPLYRALDFWAFAVTKSGAPSHPLYLKADLVPVLYQKGALVKTA